MQEEKSKTTFFDIVDQVGVGRCNFQTETLHDSTVDAITDLAYALDSSGKNANLYIYFQSGARLDVNKLIATGSLFTVEGMNFPFGVIGQEQFYKLMHKQIFVRITGSGTVYRNGKPMLIPRYLFRLL